jgi:group I intron endonuclease
MTQPLWSLYRITNKINNKVYIGQAADVSKRWHDHRRAVRINKPTQVVHHALIKYGLENFEFEVIVSCKTQDDANFIETELVKQYDSFVGNGKGYNATLGGMNAPKSEKWRQMMRDWHASLSPDERAIISAKQSISFTKYITENGHIALGTKRTPEQLQHLSQARKEHPVIYTDEIRQRLSESHIGIKDTEETKQKKSDSAKAAWEVRVDYSDIKCSAPGCKISGKAKYKFIDGIRYCNMHGLRMLRYGRLHTLTA